MPQSNPAATECQITLQPTYSKKQPQKVSLLGLVNLHPTARAQRILSRPPQPQKEHCPHKQHPCCPCEPAQLMR